MELYERVFLFGNNICSRVFQNMKKSGLFLNEHCWKYKRRNESIKTK